MADLALFENVELFYRMCCASGDFANFYIRTVSQDSELVFLEADLSDEKLVLYADDHDETTSFVIWRSCDVENEQCVEDAPIEEANDPEIVGDGPLTVSQGRGDALDSDVTHLRINVSCPGPYDTDLAMLAHDMGCTSPDDCLRPIVRDAWKTALGAK